MHQITLSEAALREQLNEQREELLLEIGLLREQIAAHEVNVVSSARRRRLAKAANANHVVAQIEASISAEAHAACQST